MLFLYWSRPLYFPVYLHVTQFLSKTLFGQFCRNLHSQYLIKFLIPLSPLIGYLITPAYFQQESYQVSLAQILPYP